MSKAPLTLLKISQSAIAFNSKNQNEIDTKQGSTANFKICRNWKY